MSLDATKWEVTAAKVIEYTGPAHGVSGANYVTVLELHRWLQDLADAETISGNDFVAITVPNPTDKKFDTIIQLLNGFVLGTTTTPAAEYIYGGSVIQGTGATEKIWDGISVISSPGVKTNVIQNGARLTNDFWNRVPSTSKTDSTGTCSGISASGQAVVAVSNGALYAAGDTLMFGSDVTNEYVVSSISGNNLTLTTNLVNATANLDVVYDTVRGLNADAANGLAMQFMVPVREFGIYIDNASLAFTTREWFKTFSDFRIPSTGRGKNSVPLTYASDLNNTTAIATTAAIADVTNTEGYRTIDANNDTVNEFYYSEWNRGAQSINSFYERIKWLTRAGETSNDIYGLDGELFRGITHQIATDTPTGTFSAVEPVTWGTLITTGFQITDTAGACSVTDPTPFTLSAGQLVRISGTFGGTGTITGYSNPTTYQIYSTNGSTTFVLKTLAGGALTTTTGTPTGLTLELQSGSGKMFAINSTTAPTALWVQLTKGVAPTDNMRIRGETSAATCLVNATVTGRALSTPMCGASTGSALIGAYGFALEYVDMATSDRFTALDGVTRQPPNNVTFTVSGVQSGWRVLVGPNNAGAILESQLSNTNLLNGAAVTTVTVDEAIPANTPATGTIRIKRADGSFSRHPYSARSGAGPSTFTITSHNFSTNNASAGADIYISYIDAAASGTSINFTTIQSGGDQTLAVFARYGGTGPNYTDSIKPANTTGVLGTTGGSATISSVSDA